MTYSDAHPTVLRALARPKEPSPEPPSVATLRQLAIDSGADDVGFVSVDHPDLADQRSDILAAFPYARALIAFVTRMHRENIRSPARSIANLEFHRAGDESDAIAHRIAVKLQALGVRAAFPPMGFPMEAHRWPGKMWVISHKPVAVAAGLGRMGIHRNVIHPKFGNFILLGTVVTDLDLPAYSERLDYNPCLECKLCVAACPTGAIAPDGHFDFTACYSHNYREFMGGFDDWVETLADARNHLDYRKKMTDGETVSLWQSLSFGPNYKAAYCLAVCPAGEDVIGPYLADRKGFLQTIVAPLRDKEETIYAVRGSDAETHVTARLPHKRVKRIGNGIRVASVDAFIRDLPLVFQRGKSAGLSATFHFHFKGRESREATVTIRDRTLTVAAGLIGKCDVKLTADSATWVRFLRKEVSLPWALLRRKIGLRGNPRLLLAFQKCFP